MTHPGTLGNLAQTQPMNAFVRQKLDRDRNQRVPQVAVMIVSHTSHLDIGAIGKLTPKKGQVATFKISQLNPKESYTFTVSLPLSRLNIHRYLQVQPDGTYFTHEVSFNGLLGWLFGLLLGRQFKAVLPSIMENVKQIAES